jgi:hypothetical protein
MSPRFKYVGHSGPIASFELHTWGEGLDMPVAIHLDREPPPEAITDFKDEVYVLGDSFGFAVQGGDIRWWIDLGPSISEWEADGIPTLLCAISGWAQAWGLTARIVLGNPEQRLWTADERAVIDRGLASRGV